MELVGWLVGEWKFLQKEEKVTDKKTAEMKFLWQQLNVFWGMDKFRDKDGNCRENFQRGEEDIPKVAVSYTLQEDETERGKLKLEEWFEGPTAWNGMIMTMMLMMLMIIIIIIII